MESFLSPEIVKPESESEKSPGSRSTEDREENRSDDPRESRSLEYTMGDEDMVGKMVGEGEKSGKSEKREFFCEEEHGPRSGSYLI